MAETKPVAKLWSVRRPSDDEVGARTMDHLMEAIKAEAPEGGRRDTSIRLDDFRAVEVQVACGPEHVYITAIIDTRGLTPDQIVTAGIARCEAIAAATRDAISALRHGGAHG